jgi:XTP/dITP diphosphohydrolase
MIPSRLVLASGNPGKVEELRSLVREWGPLEVLSLADFPALALPEEGGATYVENAIAKAVAVAAATGEAALGDDSGLEVDGLGGGPGIRSARYAGSSATDRERVAKLLGALATVPGEGRRARFRCVVALARPDGRVETAEGECGGCIALAPAGRGGFGYDPVFVADELGRTFAEATTEEKRRLSHRARAVRALGARLGGAERATLRQPAGPC